MTTQAPATQHRLLLQVAASQQGCPKLPHGTIVPSMHTEPLVGEAPRAEHVPPEQQPPPVHAALPAQHGSPGAPQGPPPLEPLLEPLPELLLDPLPELLLEEALPEDASPVPLLLPPSAPLLLPPLPLLLLAPLPVPELVLAPASCTATSPPALASVGSNWSKLIPHAGASSRVARAGPIVRRTKGIVCIVSGLSRRRSCT